MPRMLAPGVLCHVAESGEKLYTRAGGVAAAVEHSDDATVRRPGG